MKTEPEGPAVAGADNQESGMRTKSKAKPVAKRSKARGAVKGSTQKSSESVSKVETIGQLLRRKEGCTTAEVLKATGWPAVSMPQQARALGVKLKTEKVDGPNGRRVTRYHAAG